MVTIGKLTKTRKPHRVGPSAHEVLGTNIPGHLMMPLALLDGSLWGIKGNLPIVYCEYTDSKRTGLRFRRDAKGLLHLLDESKRRLVEWEEELTGMGIEVKVTPKPVFKAKFIQFNEVAEAKPDMAQLRREAAVLIAPKPVWLQGDQTPKSAGTKMRFLGQARATRFTMNVGDFHIFTFINIAGNELAIVWQNS